MTDLITRLIDIHCRVIAEDGPPTYPRERRAMAAVVRLLAWKLWQRGHMRADEDYRDTFNWLHAEANKAEAEALSRSD